MKTRKQKWLEQGYAKEQIENHLSFERYKAKQSRERQKRNNEKNKDIIAKVKNDLIGKTFANSYVKFKVLSIRPSIDGLGFWFKVNKTFKDGSSGYFRQFQYFDDYKLKSFKEEIFF